MDRPGHLRRHRRHREDAVKLGYHDLMRGPLDGLERLAKFLSVTTGDAHLYGDNWHHTLATRVSRVLKLQALSNRKHQRGMYQ